MDEPLYLTSFQTEPLLQPCPYHVCEPPKVKPGENDRKRGGMASSLEGG